jgi:hypothetical protein
MFWFRCALSLAISFAYSCKSFARTGARLCVLRTLGRSLRAFVGAGGRDVGMLLHSRDEVIIAEIDLLLRMLARAWLVCNINKNDGGHQKLELDIQILRHYLAMVQRNNDGTLHSDETGNVYLVQANQDDRCWGAS